MNYMMKASFDEGKTWYQLEWVDINFKEIEKLGKDANSIDDLTEIIKKELPGIKFSYEYIGELNHKSSPKLSKKSKKK